MGHFLRDIFEWLEPKTDPWEHAGAGHITPARREALEDVARRLTAARHDGKIIKARFNSGRRAAELYVLNDGPLAYISIEARNGSPDRAVVIPSGDLSDQDRATIHLGLRLEVLFRDDFIA